MVSFLYFIKRNKVIHILSKLLNQMKKTPLKKKIHRYNKKSSGQAVVNGAERFFTIYKQNSSSPLLALC